MQRPGVEIATTRSQVRRPNHYTTDPTHWFTSQQVSIIFVHVCLCAECVCELQL